jgi:predicted secreted Zn-dependent protease
VPRVGYQQYGIRPELVERVKRKLKNPAVKERMKALLDGVTKHDLQDRAKVRRLVRRAAAILNEPLTSDLEERIVAFVIAQRIDPNNTLHLLRLWSMFR